MSSEIAIRHEPIGRVRLGFSWLSMAGRLRVLVTATIVAAAVARAPEIWWTTALGISRTIGIGLSALALVGGIALSLLLPSLALFVRPRLVVASPEGIHVHLQLPAESQTLHCRRCGPEDYWGAPAGSSTVTAELADAGTHRNPFQRLSAVIRTVDEAEWLCAELRRALVKRI